MEVFVRACMCVLDTSVPHLNRFAGRCTLQFFGHHVFMVANLSRDRIAVLHVMSRDPIAVYV